MSTAAPKPTTKSEAYRAFNKKVQDFVGILKAGFGKDESIGIQSYESDLSMVLRVSGDTDQLAMAAAPVFIPNRAAIDDDKNRDVIINGVQQLLSKMNVKKLVSLMNEAEFANIRAWIKQIRGRLDTVITFDPKPYQKWTTAAAAAAAVGAGVEASVPRENKAAGATVPAPHSALSGSSPQATATPAIAAVAAAPVVANPPKHEKDEKKSENNKGPVPSPNASKKSGNSMEPFMGIINKFMSMPKVQSALTGQGDIKSMDAKDMKDMVDSTFGGLGDELEKITRTVGDADEDKVSESERQARVKMVKEGMMGLFGVQGVSMFSDPRTIRDRDLSLARDQAQKASTANYDTVLIFNKNFMEWLDMIYSSRLGNPKYVGKFPKLKEAADKLKKHYSENKMTTDIALACIDILEKHEKPILEHDYEKLFLSKDRPAILKGGLEVPKLVRSILLVSGKDKQLRGKPKPDTDTSVLLFWKGVDQAQSFLAIYRHLHKHSWMKPIKGMVEQFMGRNGIAEMSNANPAEASAAVRRTLFDAMANIGNNPDRAAQMRAGAMEMMQKGSLADAMDVILDTTAGPGRDAKELSQIREQLKTMMLPVQQMENDQKEMEAALKQIAEEAKSKGEDVDRAVAAKQEEILQKRKSRLGDLTKQLQDMMGGMMDGLAKTAEQPKTADGAAAAAAPGEAASVPVPAPSPAGPTPTAAAPPAAAPAPPATVSGIPPMSPDSAHSN